jgi:hypothetical protein
LDGREFFHAFKLTANGRAANVQMAHFLQPFHRICKRRRTFATAEAGTASEECAMKQLLESDTSPARLSLATGSQGA